MNAIVVLITDDPGNVGKPGEQKMVLPVAEELLEDKQVLAAYAENRLGSLIGQWLEGM